MQRRSERVLLVGTAQLPLEILDIDSRVAKRHFDPIGVALLDRFDEDANDGVLRDLELLHVKHVDPEAGRALIAGGDPAEQEAALRLRATV